MILPAIEVAGRRFENIDVSKLNPQQQERLLTLLKKHKQHEARNQLKRYKPYPKQAEFHNTVARERLFMAANQIGKTYSSAAEIAFHATGLYPDDWDGHRFTTPTVGWAAGITGESTRDTLQRLVMGRPGNIGEGSIPGHLIIEYTMARGVADLIDTVLIRHAGGGVSTLAFKSYEKGRQKWQGETLHYVAYDEEPPEDIYIEGLTRTNATDGIVWTTFTPLLGMSNVVKRFLIDKVPGTAVIKATINDALHYSQEKRNSIIASYPAHERDARAMGIPILGSGRIYPVAESSITCNAFPIPDYWPRIAAIDFGWSHPTAVVWLAIDPDTGIIYVTDCYREKEQTPVVHSAAINGRGKWIPVAWPHDGLNTEKGTGEELAQTYKNNGANMLKDKATFEDGGNSVERGISEMLMLMQKQQFKVFSHLEPWFSEFRLYHRKEGKIHKEDEDLMDATRYAVMSIRHAISKQAALMQQYNPYGDQTNGGYGVLDPTMGY